MLFKCRRGVPNEGLDGSEHRSSVEGVVNGAIRLPFRRPTFVNLGSCGFISGLHLAGGNHALQEARLRNDREVGGIVTFNLHHQLLLELANTVVLNCDARAFCELVECGLKVVRLRVTN